MVFRTPQSTRKFIDINHNIGEFNDSETINSSDIKLDGVFSNSVSSTKFWCVIIDGNLTWKITLMRFQKIWSVDNKA